MTTGRVDISHTITYNTWWSNAMKVRDVIKMIESDGWYPVTMKGELFGSTSTRPKREG
jgi:hypothetical protein